jgi:membrane-bound lytic murein transglycosylase D
MIGSIRLQSVGVICAVAILAVGCSGRGKPRFPGAIASTGTEALPAEPTAEPKTPDHVAGRTQEPATGPGAGDGNKASATGRDLSSVEAFAPTPTRLTVADLWPSAPDIDIPMNSQVKEFVASFTGTRKTFIEAGLSRSMQYLPMIRNILRAEGLPLDLAYIPLVESAFKPMALSGAQAMGIWQFMSGTGLENGLTHDWYIDERIEAEKATRAAAKYLKMLHKMFDGDWALALAAYNAGQGRVKRAMKRSGRSDYWKLTASTMYLPRETRNYVPLVMAAMVVARDPAKHGLNVEPTDAPRFDIVTLPAAVDLRWIATWIGSSVTEIQDLNPELRRWLTPIRATEHPLKVPSGTGDIIRAHLAVASPGNLAPLDWHTVEKGETLVAIARELKVTRTDLAEANYLSTRARLQVGQRLIIPRAPTLQLVRQDSTSPEAPPRFEASAPEASDVTATVTRVETVVDTQTDVDAGVDVRSPPLLAANARDVAVEPPPPESIVHRVKRGDTLFSLARLYRTTVASLKRWNDLRSNRILVGQHLTVRTGQATIATY